MVEMRETAHILAHATRRSLVVLDEIGRGTSTFDGVSIAWAVAEHLHDRIGAQTLFATHYHELIALAETRPRVRNFSMAVREWKDEIVFLRSSSPGGASRSYGIEVARLAGLDKSGRSRAPADPGASSSAATRCARARAAGRASSSSVAPRARRRRAKDAERPRALRGRAALARRRSRRHVAARGARAPGRAAGAPQAPILTRGASASCHGRGRCTLGR